MYNNTNAADAKSRAANLQRYTKYNLLTKRNHMASRDRYTIDIKCPKCASQGVMHFSENDYPFMRKLGKTLDKVEGNFTAIMQNESRVKIKCKSCGEEFFS